MNPHVAAISGSLIREIAALRRPDSIDLGLGEPSLLPQMRFFDAASAWVAEHGCKYTPNSGDPALRELIAKHYGYPGMDTAESVCLTPGGSQEAVFIAIKALLDPTTDRLLVVEPVFPTYAKLAQLEGIGCDRVSLAEADDFAFDAERILTAMTPATRMIVIVSPCNPTGRVMSQAQAQKLANALLKREGPPVYVLHDEIYRELCFVPEPGYLAELYQHTVVCNSLSKSNALTGMRIGWTIAEPRVSAALIKTQAWITVTANTFAQRIAHEIFTTPGALTEHVPWYERQREGVLAALAASGVRHVPPEGTFYVVVRLRGTHPDSLAAAKVLAAHENVITIPGMAFGAALEGWLRVSWVAPLERVAEGLRRIAAFEGAVR